MTKRILPFIVAFAGILALGVPAQAQDKLPLEQTPPKVQETIRKYVQNGKLGEIERAHEKDKPALYVVDYTAADGTAMELEIGEDGIVVVQRGKLN
ncbi:MAG: hypothetical protein K0S65_4905 [Labilithrix sp.]|nr:hypothetical protein [Labilithrix sp.]